MNRFEADVPTGRANWSPNPTEFTSQDVSFLTDCLGVIEEACSEEYLIWPRRHISRFGQTDVRNLATSYRITEFRGLATRIARWFEPNWEIKYGVETPGIEKLRSAIRSPGMQRVWVAIPLPFDEVGRLPFEERLAFSNRFARQCIDEELDRISLHGARRAFGVSEEERVTRNSPRVRYAEDLLDMYSRRYGKPILEDRAFKPVIDVVSDRGLD